MLSIQKKFTKSFYALLSLPSTAMGFALSIQISALSWILSTQYNLDIHEVGIVWAAGPLAGIVGQVLIGIISDNVWFWGGRRRPFILIGGTLAALALLALPNLGAISTTTGMSIFISAILIATTLDIAINISFNPTRSIIADVTPEGEKRTKGYTWMQTISGFFGFVAYLIGWLLDKYSLIYFGVGLVLLFSVIPALFVEEPRELKTTQTTVSSATAKSNVTELLKIYFAHAFCWLGVQTMFVFMIFFIKEAMPAVNSIAMGEIADKSFLLLSIVAFLVPSLLLEPLARKWGRIKVHVACMATMALSYFGIYWFAQSPSILYLLMITAGFGWGATVSLPFAIMTEKVAATKMGLFMGIFNLSVVIPQLIVSFVVSIFIQQAEDKTIIFLIAAIALTCSAILWMWVRERTVSDIEEKTSINVSH